VKTMVILRVNSLQNSSVHQRRSMLFVNTNFCIRVESKTLGSTKSKKVLTFFYNFDVTGLEEFHKESIDCKI